MTSAATARGNVAELAQQRAAQSPSVITPTSAPLASIDGSDAEPALGDRLQRTVTRSASCLRTRGTSALGCITSSTRSRRAAERAAGMQHGEVSAR